MSVVDQDQIFLPFSGTQAVSFQENLSSGKLEKKAVGGSLV